MTQNFLRKHFSEKVLVVVVVKTEIRYWAKAANTNKDNQHLHERTSFYFHINRLKT